jgi:hypothetical protein
MGEIERLAHAYKFVDGTGARFRGPNSDVYIRESLRLRTQRVGYLGIAGQSLADIYKMVTGEEPVSDKDGSLLGNDQVQSELNSYGIMPVLLPPTEKSTD